MRKIMFLAITLMAFTFTTKAQTNEEQQESLRIARLQQIMSSYLQEDCGIASVDNYRKAICEAAVLSITNSEQLKNLQAKENISLVDITALGTKITKESEAIKKASEQMENASKELKTITENATKGSNPLKAAKQAKQAKAGAEIMKHSATATTIIIEESAAKLKIIEEMTNAAK